MPTANLADAKTHPGTLVERAAAGETVQILRRGRPVAQIAAVPTRCKAVDPAALNAIIRRMPAQSQDAGTFIRAMRDAERYCRSGTRHRRSASRQEPALFAASWTAAASIGHGTELLPVHALHFLPLPDQEGK
jgi:antitoxin (DNA-binding transcriptional repressor) of toxin-antitoxin stability system